MSRPVKSRRLNGSVGGPKTPNPTRKVGKPQSDSGRENLGAGGYASGGKSEPMFKGPSQILKDNRRS